MKKLLLYVFCLLIVTAVAANAGTITVVSDTNTLAAVWNSPFGPTTTTRRTPSD